MVRETTSFWAFDNCLQFASAVKMCSRHGYLFIIHSPINDLGNGFSYYHIDSSVSITTHTFSLLAEWKLEKPILSLADNLDEIVLHMAHFNCYIEQWSIRGIKTESAHQTFNHLSFILFHFFSFFQVSRKGVNNLLIFWWLGAVAALVQLPLSIKSY